MSRTYRRRPGWIEADGKKVKEDHTCDGVNQAAKTEIFSNGKQGWDDIWGPAQKRFRKKKISRTRRRHKNPDEESYDE